MTFETEPLRFRPMQWQEQSTMRGVQLPDGRLLPIQDDDLALAFKGLFKHLGETANDLSLQKLVLRYRIKGPSVRLATVQRLVEFLCTHDLLENPSAREWLQLVRGESPRPGLMKRLKNLIPLPQLIQQGTVDPEAWEQLPIIRQLDPDARKEILKGAVVKRFAPGQRLCRQASRDRHLMVMLSGQASVIKRWPGENGRVVAVLEKNSVFGEVSYFLNQPRSADVVAMSTCEVLCLPPSADVTLDKVQFARLQTRLRFLMALQRNPLFQDLPADAFDALLMRGTSVKFATGEPLVREHEAADSCFFLLQGKAIVYQKGVEINRLTSGSVIGEIGLLFGAGGRTATAIADGEVQAIRYEWEEFWTVLSRHLILGISLERLASKRLNRDQTRAFSMAEA